MARERSIKGRKASDDDDDDDSDVEKVKKHTKGKTTKAAVGIFSHQVHRFRKKGSTGSDSDDDDGDDDDDFDSPKTRKRGRPKKGGDEEEAYVCVIGGGGAKKAKPNKRNAVAAQDGGDSVVNLPKKKPLTLDADDDDSAAAAYLKKTPRSSGKNESLKRLEQMKKMAIETRNALQSTETEVCVDDDLAAGPATSSARKERPKVVIYIKKEGAEDKDIKKYRMYTSDLIRVKLFEEYAKTMALDIEDMRFTYNDREVLKFDTPITLGLSDADMIIWNSKREMQEKAAKAQAEAAAAATAKVVNLKLRFDDRSEAPCKIYENDPFQKLIDKVAAWKQVEAADVKLVFDGDVLSPTSTAKSEDLENDYIIDVNISD